MSMMNFQNRLISQATSWVVAGGLVVASVQLPALCSPLLYNISHALSNVTTGGDRYAEAG